MPVKPRVVGPRLLVKPLEAAEQTTTGIVLPEEVRSREHRGMVVEVGHFSTVELDDFGDDGINVGDVVVWNEVRDPYGNHWPVRVRLDVAESGEQEEFVVLQAPREVLLVLAETEVKEAWYAPDH
jgi:co-chaperonin GroES (HSP10)